MHIQILNKNYCYMYTHKHRNLYKYNYYYTMHLSTHLSLYLFVTRYISLYISIYRHMFACVCEYDCVHVCTSISSLVRVCDGYNLCFMSLIDIISTWQDKECRKNEPEDAADFPLLFCIRIGCWRWRCWRWRWWRWWWYWWGFRLQATKVNTMQGSSRGWGISVPVRCVSLPPSS